MGEGAFLFFVIILSYCFLLIFFQEDSDLAK